MTPCGTPKLAQEHFLSMCKKIVEFDWHKHPNNLEFHLQVQAK